MGIKTTNHNLQRLMRHCSVFPIVTLHVADGGGIWIFQKNVDVSMYLEAKYNAKFFEMVSGYEHVILEPRTLVKFLRTFDKEELVSLVKFRKGYKLSNSKGKLIQIPKFLEDRNAVSFPLFVGREKNPDGIPMLSEFGHVRVELMTSELSRVVSDSNTVNVHHYTLYLKGCHFYGIAFSDEGYGSKVVIKSKIINPSNREIMVRLPKQFGEILRVLDGMISLYLDDDQPAFIVQKTDGYLLSYAVVGMKIDEIERIKTLCLAANGIAM